MKLASGFEGSTNTSPATYLMKPDGDVDVLGVLHERLDIKRYLEE